MNHAITILDLLRILAGIAALIAGAVGILALYGGMMSDDTGEGNPATGSGCVLSVIAIVLIVFALAACTTPTVTKIQTVEVKMPVAVQPITAAQVPVPPPPLGKRPADARDALDAALGKWCEAVAYIYRADPLLRISAGEKAAALDYPECRKP